MEDIDPRNLIAATLVLEAGGEKEAGMRAVASVIYNRAKIKNKTFTNIILEKKQFSCWNTRDVKTTIEIAQQNRVWATAKQIAEEMVCGTFSPIGDWTHYYNPKLCSPVWGDHLINVAYIGNHKFGKLL